jgi:transaldolase
MVTFQDTCINSKCSNPFVDDGFVWCRLKDGYFECEFDERWNECPSYKSVRQAMKEHTIYSHIRKTKATRFLEISSNKITNKNVVGDKMKIFIDTANTEEIRKANDWGIIDGVTTNPTLIVKEQRGFNEIIREIISIIDGPISVEAISLKSEDIIKEAIEMSKWSKNIVIKIPISQEGLKSVKILNDLNIKTNVTLVFSVNQAILAAKSGATYVSPFIGRLDDIGYDGMQVIRDMVSIFKKYGFNTEIIVASVRHPLHVFESAKAGADVATIPFSVIEKMFNHPLTDNGLDAFNKDWKKLIKKVD